MNEIWKEIQGFEGLYEVSNYGKVRSLYHNSRKVLKPHKDRNGYMNVTLYKGKKPHYLIVHRLVATAFVKKDECRNIVDHIDCNRNNNHFENLRWVTVAENSRYSHELGHQRCNSKPLVAESPEGQLIRFESQRQAARELGLSRSCIQRCLYGLCLRTKKGWCFKWSA